MMRRFDLHAWELSYADTPLVGVAACEARWQKRTFELRTVDRHGAISLCFRPQDKPLVHLFALRGFEPAELRESYAATDATSLRNRFALATKNGHWGRLFLLDRDLQPISSQTPLDAAHIRVCLRWDGLGCWSNPVALPDGKFPFGSASFRHELTAAQLLNFSNPKIRDYLRQSVAHGQTHDICYAYDMMPLESWEATARVFRFARGDAHQWKQVCAWIIEGHWVWPPEVSFVRWRLQASQQRDETGRIYGDVAPMLAPDGDATYDFDAVPAHKAFYQKLMRAHFHFDPQLDLELCQRHETLKRIIGPYAGAWLNSDFTPATAHQQLEAMLMLREWNALHQLDL